MPHQGGLIRPYHDKLMAIVRVLDGVVIYSLLWVIAKYHEVTWTTGYELIGLLGLLMYQFFAEYNEVYYGWRGSPLDKELLRIFVSWLLAFLAILLILFFLKEAATYSRYILGIWFLGVFLSLAFLSYSRHFLLWYLRSHGHNLRSVAIVGWCPLGLRLHKAFREMPWLGYKVLGFYDDRIATDRYGNKDITICGNIDKLYEDLRNRAIDIIYIALPLKSEDRIKDFISRMADSTASVYVVPDLFVFDLLHARWSTIQGIPVVSVYDSPFNSLDAIIKRTEDLILSIMILLIIAIPMVLIAVGVKLTSPGPVLFKQRRYGISGEEFEIFKFRTMYVHNEDKEVKQATRNDLRVTRFGRFLRRTSLDELPQFINVLQGSMSVVGPRPHAISHNEHYRKHIRGYMLRHKVRPGITGLAQVSGFRGETDTLEKMEGRINMDLEYIRHWSLWLDLKIIARTIIQGFYSKQAY